MTNKEPKEIQDVRDYQSKLTGKILIYIGITILMIFLVKGLVQRISLTLLRVKCIETTNLNKTLDSIDSIVITKEMIRNAINNPPLDKNGFAMEYMPGYLIGNFHPLFTTNFSINKPLFLTNYFTSGDIGFVKKTSKSNTLEIEIYRHSFDYNSTGNPDIEINSNQLDTIDSFEIVYYPDRYVIINQIDTIKLFTVEQMNHALSKYKMDEK